MRKNTTVFQGKENSMEKKIKFSDNPNLAKTIYGIIIAMLCITAIVIGIVAANNRSDNTLQNDPPASDNQNPNEENPAPTPPDEEKPNEEKPSEPPVKKPEKKSFLSPAAGSVSKGHSLTVPVFSATLEEWRVHSGIDISCDDGAQVFAAFDGTVSEVYTDPLLGCTVVIDHGSDVKTMYSNLKNDDTLIEVGTSLAAGEAIGTVGDTSLSELAEEPHLHFEVSVGGVKANPLEYISDESKSASLGISTEE